MASEDLQPGPRVLVIEDEEMVATFLRILLAARGFQVETAESAAAALPRLAGGGVDLVLIDRGLTDMSVLDLCAQARVLAPAARLVVLATLGSTKSALEAFRAGAADYVVRAEDGVDGFVRQLGEVLAAPAPDRNAFLSLHEESLPGDFRAAMTLLRERARTVAAACV